MVFVISLFILKATLNIRNSQRDLNKKDLAIPSKIWAIFILCSSSVFVLVAIVIMGVLIMKVF